jgi:hypothetical protein
VARGESSRSEPKSAALGVWAVFGIITLGAALLLMLTTRACEGVRESLVGTTATVAEPFAGAGTAFASLRWRDCVPGADPGLEVAAELERRGYARRSGRSSPRELPMEVAAEELEGACGVIVAIAEPTSSLGRSGSAGEAPRAVCADGVSAVGVCGSELAGFEGLGQARTETWIFPGLTADDVRRTELPSDVALAFAEAESILRMRGWQLTHQAWRREVAPGTTTTAVGREPSSGCVPWVTVAVGLGHAQSIFGPVPLSSDTATDRALVAGAACAGTAGPSTLRFDDLGGDGGVLYSVPVRTSSGPAVPEASARLTMTPEIRVVTDGLRVELPPALPGP